MRTSIFILGAIASLIFSCTSNPKEQNNDNISGGQAAIEQAGVASDTLDVADFMANVAQWSGKEVVLKGTVVHVCRHSGKRLHLMGNDETSKIRIEANDIGRFDKNLEGSEIIATGIVQSQEVGMGTGEGNKEHDEEKESNDQCEDDNQGTTQLAAAPKLMYWIDGLSYQVQ